MTVLITCAALYQGYLAPCVCCQFSDPPPHSSILLQLPNISNTLCIADDANEQKDEYIHRPL